MVGLTLKRRGMLGKYLKTYKGEIMNEQLKALEKEIFKGRRDRRIGLIREAWAVYMKTLERPWWKRCLKAIGNFLGASL